MKKDFKAALKDLEGKEVAATTIGELCVQALMQLPEGTNPSTEEKMQRFKLATKISVNLVGTADHTELTVEEAALLKEVAGKLFTPLAVGRIFEFLES